MIVWKVYTVFFRMDMHWIFVTNEYIYLWPVRDKIHLEYTEKLQVLNVLKTSSYL